MALASSGVGFQWSRWNSETERRQVILQAVQAVVSVSEVDNIDQVCMLGGSAWAVIVTVVSSA